MEGNNRDVKKRFIWRINAILFIIVRNYKQPTYPKKLIALNKWNFHKMKYHTTIKKPSLQIYLVTRKTSKFSHWKKKAINYFNVNEDLSNKYWKDTIQILNSVYYAWTAYVIFILKFSSFVSHQYFPVNHNLKENNRAVLLLLYSHCAAK